MNNNIDDALKFFEDRDKKRKYDLADQQVINVVNNSNNSIDSVRKIQNDSIGNGKKTSTSKRKKTNRKINWKVIIFALIIALGISFGPKTVNEIGERIEFHKEVNDIIDVLKEDAMLKLSVNGIDINSKVVYGVDDFSKLNVSDPMEVYVFSKVLDGVEFMNFMKSVSFGDGVCNFNDFNQFLHYYGFVNPKTGEASPVVFENMMEAQIKDTYEEYGPTAIITGIDDILGNSQGRGAR